MFELVRRRPDPRLSDLVLGYQGFRERTRAPLCRRELPTPHVVVILDFGLGWRMVTTGERHGSFVAGLDDRSGLVAHDGEAWCMQVDLTPLGARALLGVPQHELARRVVALADVLGPDADRLVERLHDAQGWAARFALLDVVLGARAASAPPPRPDVAWVWQRLETTHGGVQVDALAAELGCSRRHLSARFRDEIGLPPKVLARMLRFRQAVDRLGVESLAELAATCGYADQSHFNRDFRAFAGVTPTELLAERLPGGAGLAAA